MTERAHLPVTCVNCNAIGAIVYHAFDAPEYVTDETGRPIQNTSMDYEFYLCAKCDAEGEIGETDYLTEPSEESEDVSEEIKEDDDA
jgi:hypothetical protein